MAKEIDQELEQYRLILSRLQVYEKGIEYYYESFLTNGDDEDLHQLRVHLRKSRAILKAFAESFKGQKYLQKMTKKLGTVAKGSNQTRDLDVFLDACYHRFAPFIASLPIAFYETLVRERREERAKLDAFLKSEQVKDILIDYQLFLEHLALKEPRERVELLEEIVEAYFKTIRKHYKAYRKDKEEEPLHAIRIELKKIRYLLEAFKEEKKTASYRKMIKKSKLLQNSLGLFHDLAVEEAFVEKYIAEQSIQESDRAEFERFHTTIQEKKEEVKKEIEPLLKKLLEKGIK